MVEPAPSGRDYFSGSIAAAHLLQAVEWFFKTASQLCSRAVAWAGVRESVGRVGPWRPLCAFLAAAILANGLTLWMAARPIAPWGAALRVAIFAVAMLGLRHRGDASSVWDSSLLIRLIRR